MYLFFSILILVACVLLALVVLVQNSKGGGLAANFSSQNQIMGVRRTTDFLEKATWTLVVAVLVLSLASVIAIPKASKSGEIQTELTTDNLSIPMQQPVQQQAQPVQQQPAQPTQPATPAQ